MDDLESKIQELLKSLFSLKEQQDFFVPSIKAPTLKSPTPMGGASSPFKVSAPKAPTKMPGLPPPSKKDPVKMAQQLKNPRPTAPPTEVLKIEENGQWSLHKANTVTGSTATFMPQASTVNLRAPQPAKPPAAIGPEAGTAGSSPNASVRQAVRNKPLILSGTEHGWHHLHSPDQHRLVDGLQLHNRKNIGKGISGAAFASNINHPDHVIVKNAAEHPNQDIRGHLHNNFNSAKREVLYHDLAHHFFDLGHHVPTTAGFTHKGQDWSAQKKVNGASHIGFKSGERPDKVAIENPHHHKILQDLNNNGTLDKLAIMDHLSGHHDRHGDNYMLDDAPTENSPGLHLIDNGSAFDYGNLDQHSLPHYRDSVQKLDLHGEGGHDSWSNLHPQAKKWLKGRDVEKAKQIFAKHGHDENSPAYKGFMNRLQGLQSKTSRPPGMGGMNDVFDQNRVQTHQDPTEFLDQKSLKEYPIEVLRHIQLRDLKGVK